MKHSLPVALAMGLSYGCAMPTNGSPPPHAPELEADAIAQVRVARSTRRLDEVVRFYRDGLGLPVLGGFEGHQGYDGVMIGLPGPDRHLELTDDGGQHAPPVPGPESLLVFYFKDASARDAVVARLAALGHEAVPPANPYWVGKAVTVPDPDGFRVVLFAGTWEPSAADVPARFRGH